MQQSVMRRSTVAVATVAVCMGSLAWAVRPSAFGNQSKPMRATVQILAVSSSSRQSFAGNQEVYLAEVQVKDGERRFARLVDQYPGFGLPIRASLLRDRTTFTMLVTREPECDVSGSQIYLSPASGAIYDGSVRDTLLSKATQPVPCYKTLHQTIALPKK